MKAEPNRLISRKLTENREHLIVMDAFGKSKHPPKHPWDIIYVLEQWFPNWG